MAKMMAPLLIPLDITCPVRSLLVFEVPEVHPWYTAGAQ